MITQKFKNGKSDIRIESAESIEDAQLNQFPEGVFSRYFIDNKPMESYKGIIDHIIESTKNGGNFVMPSDQHLKQMQSDLIMNQKKLMQDQLDKLKKEYKDLGIPDSVLSQFDYMVDSVDMRGVRVNQ